MEQEVKCRSCGETMYKKTLLPDGKHWALAPRQPYQTKVKDNTTYIVCPHCNHEHPTESFMDGGLSQREIKDK